MEVVEWRGIAAVETTVAVEGDDIVVVVEAVVVIVQVDDVAVIKAVVVVEGVVVKVIAVVKAVVVESAAVGAVDVAVEAQSVGTIRAIVEQQIFVRCWFHSMIQFLFNFLSAAFTLQLGECVTCFQYIHQ